MAIEIGTTLGTFTITGLLGKGGMGEVYRARDTKLGRDVAIKVLPQVFTSDHERLMRFEREARTLATLDHPNIGSLYDLQDEGGILYLVMQLVEGETLADRIERSPLSIQECLPLFMQIAEALEAAHERGVIHRDLKPANIKLTEDGRVKVLDFGLATTQAVVSVSSPSDETKPSDKPPRSKITTDGAILGTPSYMSPEQARGKPVDKRTDIWSFGCCMFEALAGKLPFERETMTDTFAAILEREPQWEDLPKDTPWRVRELLERCLEKDPRNRLRDIGDAWSELRKLTTDSGRMSPEARVTEAPRRQRSLVFWVAVSAMIALAAGLGSMVTRSLARREPLATPPAKPVKRFEIDIGPARQDDFYNVDAEVAVSRDGSRIAYVVNSGDINRQLFIRDLAANTIVEIRSAAPPMTPFFSPDGEWVGYSINANSGLNPNRLMKAPVHGGESTVICESLSGAGATWLDDGTIVYAAQDEDLDLSESRFRSHLFRIDANGGKPERQTRADGAGSGEWSHNRPCILPGSRAVVFVTRSSDTETDIALLHLDTGRHEILIRNAGNPQYAPSGHILFVRNENLWAIPLNPETLEVVGKETLVQQNVQSGRFGSQAYAISASGDLVYAPVLPPDADRRGLVWVNLNGDETNIKVPLRAYTQARISRDGTRLALTIGSDEFLSDATIWLHDLARPTSMQQLTYERSGQPVWLPSGRHILFGAFDEGVMNLYVHRTDGIGSPQRLRAVPFDEIPLNMTLTSHMLVLESRDPQTGRGFSILKVGDPIEEFIRAPEADRQPVKVLDGNGASNGNPVLSPDEHWIAYLSYSSNTDRQTFVRPYPDVDAGRWQISTERGGNCRWAPDGHAIFYWNEGKMMVVQVNTDPTFSPDTPRVLFEGEFYEPATGYHHFDIHPDGDRFLMIKPFPELNNRMLIYVENWGEELERLAPHLGSD